MKYVKQKLALFIVSLSCLLTAVSAQAVNLGVVDVDAALRASDAAKAFETQLQADLSSARNDLVALEKTIKDKQTELQQSQDLLSQEQLAAEDQKFRQMVQEFQGRRQALNQEQVKREQVFLKQVRPTLRAAVLQIAKEKNLDMILNKEAAAFADSSLDVTARLIEILNTEK